MWSETETAFERFFSIFSPSARRYLDVEDMAKRAGRPALARECLQQAQAMDPSRADTYVELGVFSRDQLKDRAGAIAAFTEATRLNPRYASALNDRGILYEQEGRRDLAEHDFLEAVRLDTRRANPYYHLGASCFQQARYEEAARYFTQAIELVPTDVELWFSRGYAHLMLKDYEAAIADNTRAIELDPDHASAYNNRAHAYRQLGLMVQAQADRERWRALTTPRSQQGPMDATGH